MRHLLCYVYATSMLCADACRLLPRNSHLEFSAADALALGVTHSPPPLHTHGHTDTHTHTHTHLWQALGASYAARGLTPLPMARKSLAHDATSRAALTEAAGPESVGGGGPRRTREEGDGEWGVQVRVPGGDVCVCCGMRITVYWHTI